MSSCATGSGRAIVGPVKPPAVRSRPAARGNPISAPSSNYLYKYTYVNMKNPCDGNFCPVASTPSTGGRNQIGRDAPAGGPVRGAFWPQPARESRRRSANKSRCESIRHNHPRAHVTPKLPVHRAWDVLRCVGPKQVLAPVSRLGACRYCWSLCFFRGPNLSIRISRSSN